MLVGTNTQLVELPQQLGFSFPACVGGDEAEAVLARRDGRELFPETPGRFRGIAPELVPGGEAVVRACGSCILGRQDRDRAPVRKANLLGGDRRRTCERGIRLSEFHQRGEHSPLSLLGWYEDLSDGDRRNLWGYMKRGAGDSADAAPALLRLAWSSRAALAIAPLQDVLNLGKDARMNRPGSADGNWRWRCTDDMLSTSAFQALRDLTQASGRSGSLETQRTCATSSAAS